MKNKFLKLSYILSLLLLISGGIYMLFWFIIPSTFLSLTIGIPHLLISLLLFIMIPIFIVVGIFINKKSRRYLKRTVLIYLFNIVFYLFIVIYAHPFSVSQVYIENKSNEPLTNITISYYRKGKKIYIDKIEKGKQKHIPIITRNEGELLIEGKIGNENFIIKSHILEIKGYKFRYEIKSSKDIKYFDPEEIPDYLPGSTLSP